MKLPVSELAWNFSDYEAAGVEAPPRVRSNPELTEGEMMSVEEVEEFIKDSIATLRILADKKSPRYKELVEVFRADMAYLLEVGSLDEDDYNGLTDSSNLHF
jgi:hypothetical protein